MVVADVRFSAEQWIPMLIVLSAENVLGDLDVTLPDETVLREIALQGQCPLASSALSRRRTDLIEDFQMNQIHSFEEITDRERERD